MDRKISGEESKDTMSDEEAELIADKILEKLSTKNKSFYIDPKTHYDAHQELDKFLKSWTEAKTIWAKLFLSAMGFGAMILIGISFWKK